MMHTIDIRTELEFKDGTYMVAEMEGNLIRLRSVETGAYSTVHLADLSRRLVEPPTYPPVDVRALDELGKQSHTAESKKLREMAGHIEEMVTGLRASDAPGTTPRTEYDPEHTSLSERMDAKSKELKLLKLPYSRATLKRRKRAYEQGGLAGLMDGRHNRHQPPLANLDAAVSDAINKVVNAQTKESTVSKKRILELVKQDLIENHQDFDWTHLPSERTLYRFMDFYMKSRYTTGDSRTRRSAAHTPDDPFTAGRPMYPGQQVQIDSTTFDAYVLDGRGKASRPDLTIMLDVATRSIIAFTFRLVSSKGIDHAFLLAQALTVRRQRPGYEELGELARLLSPGMPSLSRETRDQADLARPFIYPINVVTDNAMAFRGTTFEAACLKFGVNIIYAAPDDPISKPEVERIFLTIKNDFSSRLPGFVGGSLSERGDSPESDDLFSLAVVAELFDGWVSVVYQNNPHEGLRDPMHPRIILSPNQMYRAMSSLSGQLHLPIQEQDYIELLPVDVRKITSEGVEFDYRHYNSVELQALRSLPSDQKSKKYKWEVRSNPYNPRLVWVRHPDNGWIECVWREDATFQQPYAAAIWREARHIAREIDGEETPGKLEFIAQVLSARNAAKAEASKNLARSKAAFGQALAEGTPMPGGTSAPNQLDDDYSTQWETDQAEKSEGSIMHLDAIDEESDP